MFGYSVINSSPLMWPTHSASIKVENIIYISGLHACTTGKTVNVRVQPKVYLLWGDCKPRGTFSVGSHGRCMVGEWDAQKTWLPLMLEYYGIEK